MLKGAVDNLCCSDLTHCARSQTPTDLWSLGVLPKTQSWKSCLSALTSAEFWSSASCLTDRLPQHAIVHKWPCGQQRLASSGQGGSAADDTCLLACMYAHAITPVLRHSFSASVNMYRIKLSSSSHCYSLSHQRLTLPSDNCCSAHSRMPPDAKVLITSESLCAGSTQHVPVLIAGAGPTGLTLSILLRKLGIPSLVVDRSSGLPNHPQACTLHASAPHFMQFEWCWPNCATILT